MSFAELVAGVLEVQPDAITDTADHDTLPAWTSLRHLELVVTIEEHYGLSLSYADIRGIRSIGELRRVLRAKGVDA